MRVPLPTPDGPVMAKSGAAERAGRARRRSAQHRAELGALALREPADGLARRVRHCSSTLFTLTRPYFGTARSMSKTLAVSMYSGGSRRRSWMDARPALRSRLSWARRVRISFARPSASIRCRSDSSGAATPEVFVGVFTAGGTGESTWMNDGASTRYLVIRLDLKLRS